MLRAFATYRFLGIALGYGQIMSDSHLFGTLLDVAFHQLERRILAGPVRRQWPYGTFSGQVDFDGLSSDIISAVC